MLSTKKFFNTWEFLIRERRKKLFKIINREEDPRW
jgi:hypothetical protein